MMWISQKPYSKKINVFFLVVLFKVLNSTKQNWLFAKLKKGIYEKKKKNYIPVLSMVVVYEVLSRSVRNGEVLN